MVEQSQHQEHEPHTVYTLKATSEEVDSGNHSDKLHPHFRLPLSTGEERIIGNLSFKVLDVCPQTQWAKVSLSPIESDSHGLSSQEIRQEGDILRIGQDGEIVLRKYRDNGRPVFHMCIARIICIHSREQMIKILRSD